MAVIVEKWFVSRNESGSAKDVEARIDVDKIVGHAACCKAKVSMTTMPVYTAQIQNCRQDRMENWDVAPAGLGRPLRMSMESAILMS